MTEILRFAIAVNFTIKRDRWHDFLCLIKANASASLALEAGCLQFDVLIPVKSEELSVFLYEIYLNREAFEEHLKSEHFIAFAAKASEMIIDRKIDEFWLVHPDAHTNAETP